MGIFFKVVFLRLAKKKANCLEAGQQIEDDLADGSDRQSQDQPREPPELAKEKEGKDRYKGIDADLGAYYIRCDQIAFHNVYEEEYSQHAYGIPGRILCDQGDDKGQGAAYENADIGDDNE